MGVLESFLGQETGDESDFIELTDENLKASDTGVSAQIHLADIEGQRDMMAIKDALYGGDIVFANMANVEMNEMSESRVRSELKDVVNEIDGDIVSDGHQSLILAPKGVGISREKLK